MILEEIRLTDFRCFFGESLIRFSEDPEKNVTIIYAENGVGKTTLLNALLWCFYGETTKRFEKKEDILNYDSKREGRTTASVEVLFEHNEKRYIAKRFSSTSSMIQREFVVSRIEEGSQITLDSPDTFINTVIPRDMASHFLFDGEHAEVFLGENNKNSIRGAVRDILGCSLIETAILDIQAVSNQFRKQIPTTPTTKRIQELNEKLDLLTEQAAKAQAEIDHLKKNTFKLSNRSTILMKSCAILRRRKNFRKVVIDLTSSCLRQKSDKKNILMKFINGSVKMVGLSYRN